MEPVTMLAGLGAFKLIYDAIGKIDEAEQHAIARYQLGSRIEALEQAKMERRALMANVQQQTARDMLAAMNRRTRY